MHKDPTGPRRRRRSRCRGRPSSAPRPSTDAHAPTERAPQDPERLEPAGPPRGGRDEFKTFGLDAQVLRGVQELGPELGRTLLERIDFASWGVDVPADRIETEGLAGQTRRRGLSEMARDVERTLGRVRRHDDAAAARELFTQGSPA